MKYIDLLRNWIVNCIFCHERIGVMDTVSTFAEHVYTKLESIVDDIIQLKSVCSAESSGNAATALQHVMDTRYYIRRVIEQNS